MNLYELEDRKEIPVYAKYQEKPTDGRHLVNYKVKKEYDYYKCDYCNSEIIITKKESMKGGIVEFSHVITKRGKIKMALCNKCLNPVLKIFEEGNNANR